MDMSGLAVEAAKMSAAVRGPRTAQSSDSAHGICAAERTIGAVKITDVKIPQSAEQHTGKRAGRYITLEGEPHAEGMCALVQRGISQLIPPRGRLFAVGLGNPDITQDSLGAAVIRAVTARAGNRYTLAALETDVAARTGIDTARLVRAAARELKADCVIAFDALSCCEPRRIGRTVQLSDTGLVPGSGADEPRRGLSRETLGVPIAAVGVPTMSVLADITGKRGDGEFHVTASDIDALVRQWAEVLAGAVDLLIGK